MQKIKNFFLRVGHFIKKHKWSILLIGAALLVGGFFVWDSYSAQNGSLLSLVVDEEKEPELLAAPLSGIMVGESVVERRPIAIVVENHPDARPQSGLLMADMVFETLAEGGITRFLAIYHSQTPKEVGPVRSARPYFVEWADSFDALYAHVGGSDEGLALINRLSVADINQFAFGNFFWRDNTRYAPHNVYTTLDKIYSAAKTRNYALTQDNLKPYSFKEEAKEEERPEAQKFTVNFNYSFAPTYTYSKDCNCYLRSILGQKHLDSSGKQLSAKNVIVAFSDMGQQIVRGTGYTVIDTDDSGTAYFYIDGIKQVGKWSRAVGEQIKFYDAEGQAVALNPGTTWIDVVPEGTSVK
ncbi:MAG: DUF3048 domain-containing protein [Patescibacteria group bacterium]|nr:DUF3048 domain-containing protein [Patescibacteria group bacterium]